MDKQRDKPLGQRRRQSTIIDVAETAGVAIGTVSRHLNGLPVRAANRDRIERAIADLGYRRNSVAVSMKTDTTHIVGLMVPSLGEFHAALLEKLSRKMRLTGRAVLSFCHDMQPQSITEGLEFFASHRVDALVIDGEERLRSQILKYVDEGLIVVLYDNDIPGLPVDRVFVENRKAGARVVDHLLDLGHRRVATIYGNLRDSAARERLAGFHDAYAHHGMAAPLELVVGGDWRETGGYAALRDLMALPEPPTAVFSANYNMTLGALTWARENGIRIPEDLSLASFDDVPAFRMHSPGITAIGQPIEKLAESITALLSDRLANPDAMAVVELENVSKSYGVVEVIEGLNLRIEDGSFTVFVGPSGCGKSTLLRMIAGLEPITAGDVQIDGRRVNDAEPIERGVAMVFQNYALYPHMTVEQNIGFSLRMARLSREQIAARVAAAAATLQIEPLLKRRPAELSGGQRQRVAIGRAIVRDPEVFLFDEPLSNLDAELRVSMRVEIAKLHKQLGSTMIYVTHDQTEAMTLADKIVVMRAGKVEQAGSPEALYDDPANSFVAGFIGSPRMNFLPGTASAGQVTLADGTRFSVPGLPPAGPVDIGIRPEHFIVGDGGETPLELLVDVVENLGGTRYLYGSLPSGAALVVEARDRPGIRAGDSIRIGVQPGRAFVFDAGGRRLRAAH